ncbi:hypothetical protein HX882_21845 [Pseudomonas gingeri]|uniref:Nitrile hydratase n=1 Tax=Pseudomonas gingeri TaxID=117681 RepID=A0A7Y7XES1_9PSED|nr:Os1348 family NHLP clan protein [Pseudomonas gingeri]NWB98543.1 hypothetical protein [Pseudomonas gingeri]
MPYSNKNHQEHLAILLGRATRDASFATELQANPIAAAKDLDITLRIDEVVALKGLDLVQLAAASNTLRSPLAAHANVDPQQARTN